MKLLYTFLLLICLTGQGIAREKHPPEFLLGIRSGAGAMFSNYCTFNSTTTTYFRHNSFTVPLKLEVMFGFSGFRIGYQFEYRAAFISSRSVEFSNPALTDSTETYRRMANITGHYFIMEYAFFVKKKVWVAPSFSIGGFFGNFKNRDDDTKTSYSDFYSKRICLNAGINFEFTGKRAAFIIAPNYTFYNFREINNPQNGGGYHAVSLDLGIRLNLTRKGNTTGRTYYIIRRGHDKKEDTSEPPK